MRFVYDGWNLIAELDATQSPSTPTLHRSHVWGLDLSQSLQGAGGVGGLLFTTVHSPQSTVYAASFDGNGNVTALVDANTGNTAASYEYSPFGELLSVIENSESSIQNPFRFSTKYLDAETGLLYYGYRYYQPSTGRWLSQDTIYSDLNLYGFCANNAITHVDLFGLKTVASLGDNPGDAIELQLTQFPYNNAGQSKNITFLLDVYVEVEENGLPGCGYTINISFERHLGPKGSIYVREWNQFVTADDNTKYKKYATDKEYSKMDERGAYYSDLTALFNKNAQLYAQTTGDIALLTKGDGNKDTSWEKAGAFTRTNKWKPGNSIDMVLAAPLGIKNGRDGKGVGTGAVSIVLLPSVYVNYLGGSAGGPIRVSFKGGNAPVNDITQSIRGADFLPIAAQAANYGNSLVVAILMGQYGQSAADWLTKNHPDGEKARSMTPDQLLSLLQFLSGGQ